VRFVLRGLVCLPVLLSLSSFSAMATPVSWSVNGTFNTTGTVTGSFVWDADTSSLTNISLVITAASPAPSGSLTFGLASSIFVFFQSPAQSHPGLWLAPASTLTNAGGSVALTAPSFVGNCSSSDCNGLNFPSGYDPTVTGSILGTPVVSGVPEIYTLPALLVGLAGIGLVKRRARVS
jgi:hypothetical protein